MIVICGDFLFASVLDDIAYIYVMSTPVSVEAPAASRIRSDSEQERDLQRRMQDMIDLQNQQQHMSERGSLGLQEFKQLGDTTSRVQQPSQNSIAVSKRTINDLNAMGGESEEEPLVAKNSTTPYNSARNDLGDSSPFNQQGVGKGTLYFSKTYQSTISGSDREESPYNSYLSKPPLPGGRGGDTLQQSLQQSPRLGPHPPQQHHQPQANHRYDVGYGSVVPPPQQEHEWYYGNPDHHDGITTRSRPPQDVSFIAKCCCILQPLINILSMQHLQRSFCYGAIDGMLTGSGIVSAFCGLQVLTITATYETRLAVVAFSAAACIADALCMAIGHVWTCLVVSSGHAAERARERHLLDLNKADAKGKLVDMLLAKGMLKIDAMSLADTLEGYPDLFVSTLVGDSLLGGGDENEGVDEADSPPPEGGTRVIGGMSGSSGAFGSWKFPSYGQFNEMQHDPEAGVVNVVMRESQMEGLFMMFSFAIFATIPSLLWLILPDLVVDQHHGAAASEHPKQSSTGQTISLPSLVVTVTAIVMWCLGVWKSRFMDSNWIIFGIETVVVLLICVMSSYGVGAALASTLLGASGANASQILGSV